MTAAPVPLQQMSDADLLKELARLRGPTGRPSHGEFYLTARVTQELRARRVSYPKSKIARGSGIYR